jgi:hypothetical protein
LVYRRGRALWRIWYDFTAFALVNLLATTVCAAALVLSFLGTLFGLWRISRQGVRICDYCWEGVTDHNSLSGALVGIE